MVLLCVHLCSLVSQRTHRHKERLILSIITLHISHVMNNDKPVERGGKRGVLYRQGSHSFLEIIFQDIFSDRVCAID